MVRLILFLVVAVGLAWGLAWLADHPGLVSLDWGGWRVETSAGVLALAVAAFAVAAALLYRLWLFITRAPGRIGGALKERRSQKGYKALTKGMVAVAAGDAEEARRQVGKADGLLGEPPLTLLLKAQAAQLGGDETAAETFFKAMLDEPEMEFLGLRGLLNQALKRGDDQAALELARRAHALRPKSEWLGDALFKLEARTGHWLEAGEALKRLGKVKRVSEGEARHSAALVLLGQSAAAERNGDKEQAMKLAAKAVGEDGGLTPAALQLAKLRLAAGEKRKARAGIEEAWAIAPHPGLAELYYEAADAADALKKVAAANTLLALRTGHPDGHLAVAQAALDAKLWGEARAHLEAALAAGRATRAVYTLLARLEDNDRGDKDKVRHWLAQAAGAAADPAWVCGHCGQVEAHWRPHCPKCHEMDTLKWETPPGYAALDSAAGRPRLASS